MNALNRRGNFYSLGWAPGCRRMAVTLVLVVLVVPWVKIAAAGGVGVAMTLEIPVADPCVRAIAAGGHLALARTLQNERNGNVRMSCSGGQLRVDHNLSQSDVLKYSRAMRPANVRVDADGLAHLDGQKVTTSVPDQGEITLLAYSFL